MNIQKDKAMKQVWMNTGLNLLHFLWISPCIGFIQFFINDIIFYGSGKTVDVFMCILYGLFISLVWAVIYFKVNEALINTLEYSIEDDHSKLTKRWRIITNQINIAKLQVVNSTHITQTLMDRLTNVYTLEVDYGFSSSGYVFTFDYLTLEDAQKIEKELKPKGKIGVNLQ